MYQLILAAHRRCFLEENKLSVSFCFFVNHYKFIVPKKCPQKLSTKSPHKKCPNEVSTKSVKKFTQNMGNNLVYCFLVDFFGKFLMTLFGYNKLFSWNNVNKNPAYGRQSISRPMRIVAPIPQKGGPRMPKKTFFF